MKHLLTEQDGKFTILQREYIHSITRIVHTIGHIVINAPVQIYGNLTVMLNINTSKFVIRTQEPCARHAAMVSS